MKQFYRTIALFFAAIFGMFFVACSGGKTAALTFELKEELPKQVEVGTEFPLREYLIEEENARYNLYLSYVDPNTGEEIKEKKQSSLTIMFDLATTYTLKIEKVMGSDKAYVTREMEVLPLAPEFMSVNQVSVEKGAKKTFAALVESARMLVSPSDLLDDVKFHSVKIEKATFTSDNTTVPELNSEETIAETATSYTFSEEATYTFDISITNKSGTATDKLVVSTVDQEKAAAIPELTYAPREKMLTWDSIANATAYRVIIDDEIKQVNDAGFSFSEYEDGDYQVTVYPIYGTSIYVNSFKTEYIYVGVVTTPLMLTRKNYTISWEDRPFATGYTVTENGKSTTLPNTTLTYTLQNTYATHTEVTVEVVANFEKNQTTQAAQEKFNYGTLTFDAWNLDGATNKISAYTGVEFVEVGDGLTDTFFMVEYTGKNAPNFAVRATKGYDSINIEDMQTEAYWHNPGMMMWNSYVDNHATGLEFSRGLCSAGGNIDRKVVMAADDANAVGPGMDLMQDNTKYIMIVSYEVLPDSPDLRNGAKISCWLFTVSEDDTITKIFEKNQTYAWSSHALTGTKAIIYPNVATMSKEDGITFTYYQAKDTLANVVNDSSSPYKADLKEILGV